MTDLKSLLWNNRTPRSEKNKYHQHNLKLTEWPDFGFVREPQDYIVLSAYLMKDSMSYEGLKRLTDVDSKTLNHFIYVCRMLRIIEVAEPEKQLSADRIKRLFKTDLSEKLRAMFF